MSLHNSKMHVLADQLADEFLQTNGSPYVVSWNIKNTGEEVVVMVFRIPKDRPTTITEGTKSITVNPIATKPGGGNVCPACRGTGRI